MYMANDFFSRVDDSRIQCHVCPHQCILKENHHGLCFVRANINNQMTLLSYGKTAGLAIDPIEKKPLNHFYPGSQVLSFGTIGCNLSCKFCQNWEMSTCKDIGYLLTDATPSDICKSALLNNCKSVAFTYNDPVPSIEYYLDIAEACSAQQIMMVAVSSGYITDQAAAPFYAHTDAANIDLKGFSEDFYRRLTGASLQPVLETLKYIANETSVWLEITNLIIPDENDSDAQIDQMTSWIVDNLGVDVPLSFSAFHPAWKLSDKGRTPLERLLSARDIAIKNGIRYVYCGNVYSPETAATRCHNCHALLIERDGFHAQIRGLSRDGLCLKCQTPIPGRF